MNGYKIVMAAFLMSLSTLSKGMETTSFEGLEVQSGHMDVDHLAALRGILDQKQRENNAYSGQGELVKLAVDFEIKKGAGGIETTARSEDMEIADVITAQEALHDVFVKTSDVVTKWGMDAHEAQAVVYLKRYGATPDSGWRQSSHPKGKVDVLGALQLNKKCLDGNPLYGWSGGIINIKPGKPEERVDQIRVLPKLFNHLVLVNNGRNSHNVTEVTPREDMLTQTEFNAKVAQASSSQVCAPAPDTVQEGAQEVKKFTTDVRRDMVVMFLTLAAQKALPVPNKNDKDKVQSDDERASHGDWDLGFGLFE